MKICEDVLSESDCDADKKVRPQSTDVDGVFYDVLSVEALARASILTGRTLHVLALPCQRFGFQTPQPAPDSIATERGAEKEQCDVSQRAGPTFREH